MPELSPIALAIRHYKLNASNGYPEWAKVPCTPGYKMHVPSMGFDTYGPVDNEKIVFGWLSDIGAQQELVDILEFGPYITCHLNITDKDGGVLKVVEVFKIGECGRVEEIWAL